MKEIQHYQDWKKKIKIWEEMNSVLKVNKKLQAAFLFESLQGTPQQIVLSELSVSQIVTENGVKNIIDILDQFLPGNETINAYMAIDDLIHFKCNENSSLQQFLMEFQIKLNKVKASGTVLSEGILGYMLLSAANLPENKNDLIKAMCEELSYKNVMNQLKKVGLFQSQVKNLNHSFRDNSQNSRIKYSSRPSGENIPLYYNCEKNSQRCSNQSFEGKKVYNLRKNPSRLDQVTNKKPRMNATLHFGRAKECSFCKCVYHWKDDCPNKTSTGVKSVNVPVKKSSRNSSTVGNTKFNSRNVVLYTSNSDPVQLHQLNHETLGHAVVDTGCPRTVAGDEWLNIYVSSLSRKDRLSIRMKQSVNKFCFGDGKLYYSECSVVCTYSSLLW